MSNIKHLATLLITSWATACAPITAQPVGPAADAPVEPEVTEGEDGIKRIVIKAGQRLTSRHARCGLEDVRTDDLGTSMEVTVPRGTWPDLRRPGDDRCGDDQETLSLRLLNCEREARGIEPLACDLRMVWLAREHARNMEKRAFFSHTGSDGSSPFDRMKRRKVAYSAAAENICQAPDVQQAHVVWMDSDGHRKNILNPVFQYAGVGLVPSKHGLMLATEFFTPLQ